MDRLLGTRHLLPMAVLVIVIVADLAAGTDRVVFTLAVISPLIAASVVRRRATAVYGVLALVTAGLLGVYDHQYDDETLVAQVIRLVGITCGGLLAVLACDLRQRREELVARLRVEAATSRGAVQLAESLQRSLLTDPPVVPGLGIAVRYLPAVEHAQVGGDWYDAFPLPDGSTMLVIGDVAGHDIAAATTMASARGVLRGIATTVVGSPAAVLTALDRSLDRLQVDTLITAVVASVHPATEGGGAARLDWSNAGHPPPVLITADGTARLLEHPADLLLGVAPDAVRTEHQVPLSPGDTVLFYTDGLVERRGVPLEDSSTWLVGRLAELAELPPERLLDALLADMADDLGDDVAVLAVRVG